MIDRALFQRLQAALAQLNRVILGKNDAVALTMCCLLARGHVLLEDVPGTGKTTLAKAFAATLGLRFRRIQFTSDLLPADVVGFSMPHRQSGKLEFHPGPVFTELLLADEINRASPKSQSALLEAMEERQVTIERDTHPLPKPFMVFATQNPKEQVGTFALPESQLDRFLMRLSLGYPAPRQEIRILGGAPREAVLGDCRAFLAREDIVSLQESLRKVRVSEALVQYVHGLLAHTRDPAHFHRGLSTRAGLGMIQAARAYALLTQAPAVLPEHVQKVFPAVALHRLPEGGRGGQAHAQAVHAVLEHVTVPI